VNIALELAERAVFMEKGEVRFTGPTADLLGRDDLLRSVFIGAAATDGEPPRPAPALGRPALTATGLTKSFGGLRAVDQVDLEVRAGEIVGIIGPNGAGKTTLLDLLAGSLRADRGRVLLGEEDVSELGAAERAVRGIARSFQDARLFPGLTVEENLAVALERFTVSRDLAAAALRLPASVLSEALAARQVEVLVAALGLRAFGDKFASELSTSRARSCCSTSPGPASPSARRRRWRRCCGACATPPALPSWWSSTTCRSSSPPATAWWRWNSAASSPTAPRPRSWPIPPWWDRTSAPATSPWRGPARGPLRVSPAG